MSFSSCVSFLLQDILFGSDHEASLYLANLVEGTYLFQLRVSDGQGRSSTAMATVEVRPGRVCHVCKETIVTGIVL